MAFPVELVVIGMGWLMVGVGLAGDRLRLFKSLGSMLLIVVGVVILQNGIATVIVHDNLINQALGFINIAGGFFFLINDAFSYEKQVNTFDQEDDGRFHDNDK